MHLQNKAKNDQEAQVSRQLISNMMGCRSWG